MVSFCIIRTNNISSMLFIPLVSIPLNFDFFPVEESHGILGVLSTKN